MSSPIFHTHTARVACAVSMCLAWAVPVLAGSELDAMREKVRAEFPSVVQISTGDLASWLADKSRPAPVLLDVRTEAEFAVSHLPGARRIDPGASPAHVIAMLQPDTSVLVYCSIGYRSSKLAERLQRAGVARVFNLDGSIFQWANEGRPLQRAGGPASLVHPYDKAFGKSLKAELRAPVPAVRD